MKRALLAAAFASTMAACGGGGGGVSFKDPDSVHFTYDSYAPPDFSEEGAAVQGEAGAASALALTEASDDGHAQSLANLPDSMAGEVFDETMPASVEARMSSARGALTGRAAAYASGDLVTAAQGFDDPTCVEITLTSIHYDQCTYTDDEDPAATAVIRVDGTFTRGLTSVTWNASVTMSMRFDDPEGDIAVSVGNHMSGDVAVTEVEADLWSIAGFARSDASASASGQGHSVSMAFSHNVDLDLLYQPSIDCVVDGTLELKRIWAQRPQGATSADLPDVGVMFDWNGCGSVQVSWGTL